MLIFSLLLNMQSHPTWVRGLKLNLSNWRRTHPQSHPTWVRGLKPISSSLCARYFPSHPTWVRGLKHHKST